jgi:phosphatidate cytidylyltransferase
MALNRQTFRTRTLTAVIFVIVMLAGLLWNQWSFLLLFSVIHFGCWWEYLSLTEKICNTRFHTYTRFGFILMGFGIMLCFCGDQNTNYWYQFRINNYNIKNSLSLPVSASGFALLIIGIFQKMTVSLRAFAMAVVGLVYISLSLGLMLDLYGLETGNPLIYKESYLYVVYLPLFVIVCMWVNDTMAYIVGSLIGKTPLSKISPKKTWEGTVGGILLACLIVGYIGYVCDEWFVFGHTLGWWIGLALVATISGTIGDLLESKLKRMAGVKDSGTLMPGHGGFLDRFDSLLVAIIFAWVYVTLVRA